MMKAFTLGFILLFVPLSAQASFGQWQAMDRSAVRVIDGDTIAYQGKAIRIIGLDAPEVERPLCTTEKQAGLAAQQYARQLVAAAKTMSVQFKFVRKRNTGALVLATDKYGRGLANIRVDDKDWSGTMVNTNHAKPWSGRGPKPTWCQ